MEHAKNAVLWSKEYIIGTDEASVGVRAVVYGNVDKEIHLQIENGGDVVVSGRLPVAGAEALQGAVNACRTLLIGVANQNRAWGIPVRDDKEMTQEDYRHRLDDLSEERLNVEEDVFMRTDFGDDPSEPLGRLEEIDKEIALLNDVPKPADVEMEIEEAIRVAIEIGRYPREAERLQEQER